jgi:outer membrane protein assembly factor BamB
MRRLVSVRGALIALLAAIAVLAPSAQAATLFGDASIEPSLDSNTAGQAEAFQTTASASGTVSTLSVYLDSGSSATSVVAGLYSDASGHPGTLLTQATLAAPVAGAWNTIAVTPVAVSGGSSYWLALLGPSGTIKFRDRCCGGGTTSEASAQTTLTSLPSTWSGGGVYHDGPVSAYGSSTSSTGQAVLSIAPASLDFGAEQGGPSPAAAPLSVGNSGSGTLSFTVSTDAAWLTATPTSGSAPQTIQVSAASSTLSPGTYAGHVTISAGGATGSPAVVPVTLAVSQAGQASDWLTVDQNPARTGAAPSETTISPTTAAGLAPIWSAPVDGKVTAQPLYAKGVQVAGAAHDVVVASTSNNSVYAIDANTGSVLWQRNLGAESDNCAIPGGFGVTGAPVVDRLHGRVYAVADDGSLHSLSLSDGSDAAPPLALVANPATNKVWGGLNLIGSTLYVASASDGCDTAPWRGQIYRLDVSGFSPQLLGSFAVVPSIAAPNGGGGIWGYGGVAADASTGNILAATGADSNETYTPYGDRMVALGSTLNVLGSFGPPEPSSFPCAGAPCDLDFGATPAVFQPSGCPTLVAAGNKNGNLYLFKESDLAASAAPLQTLTLNADNDWLGSGGVGGVPAYWPAGRMLFVTDAGPGVAGVSAGIVALNVLSNCTLQVAWSAPLGGNTQPNSTPTVANGVVFVGVGNGGAVYAFNAQTGAALWNSGGSGGATYAAPTVADGKLFVGSWNGFSTGDGGTIRAFAPSTSSPSVLGDQSVESSVDSDPAGLSEAFRTAAPSSGTLTSLSVYLDSGSTATSVAVGLYADSGGHPGALLGQGTISAPIGGAWNNVALPPTSITGGSAYWIALLSPTGSGTVKFRDRCCGGGTANETSAQATLSSLPATWTTGKTYKDGPLSAYGSLSTVVDTQPPSAPTGLGATVSGSSVTLSWTAASDNVGVSNYDVYRSTTAGFTPSASNRIAQPTGATYTDNGLAAGTYYYLVTAQDAAGNESAPSNQASATVTAPPPTTTLLLGDQSVESSLDSDPGGMAEAFRTTAASSGILSTLSLYVDSSSAASKLVIGLYSDSGGHPGTLLAVGTLSSPAAGAWNTVAVSSVSITSGGVYWLALLSPSGSGTVVFRDRCCGSGSASETSSQTALATLPSGWTTGKTYKDGPSSSYGSGS